MRLIVLLIQQVDDDLPALLHHDQNRRIHWKSCFPQPLAGQRDARYLAFRLASRSRERARDGGDAAFVAGNPRHPLMFEALARPLLVGTLCCTCGF